MHFLDRVASQHMPTLMEAADIQIALLADQALFRITLPGKVQRILACGQPVLVCAPADAARIVQVAGAGLTAPLGDFSALATSSGRCIACPGSSYARSVALACNITALP